MKIIDRYLIREFLSPFLLAIFVFAVILLTDVIIRSIEIFITNKVGFGLVFRFLLTSLPFILQVTIPMAVLTGALIAFGRLSADSELTALRANGISLYRMAFPVMGMALVMWGISQFITLSLIPTTARYRLEIAYEILESNVNIGIKPHVFNDAFPGLVIYTDDLQPRTGLMQDIFMFRDRDQQSNFIFAKRGLRETFPDSRQIVFSLQDGVIHEIGENQAGGFATTRFQRNDIIIDLPDQQQSDVSVSDEELDFPFLLKAIDDHERELVRTAGQISELNASIEQLKSVKKQQKVETVLTISPTTQGNVNKYIKDREQRIEEITANRKTVNRRLIKFKLVLHKKFAFPLACLVFPLIGIPLGLRSRAGGKSTGFSLSIALILVYYILFIGGENLSRDGTVRPWIGIWSANIVMTCAGIYLFYKVATERPFKLAGWFGWKLMNAFHRLSRVFQKSRAGLQKPSERHRRTLFFNNSIPRILDLYISKEFIRIFVLLCLVIVSLTVIVEFISSVRYLLEFDAAFMDFMVYIFLRIPFFLVLSIHIAVLITTILTINNLAKNNELTAMKASGISLIRASMPMFIIAFIIASGVLIINERVVPRTNNLAQDLFQYKIKQKSRPSLFAHNKNWYRGAENSIYSFSSFDQRGGKSILNDFLLYNLDDRFLPSRKVTARQVIWDESAKRWVFEQGEEMTFDHNGVPLGRQVFASSHSFLKEDVNEFQHGIKDSDKMNYRELKSYVTSLQAKGIDTMMYRTDLMAKLSMPFISWVIALFGIPFAITFARSGTMMGIGFSIFIGMVYFVAYRIGISLGHSGQLPPLLSAWGANFLFTFIGLYLIIRART